MVWTEDVSAPLIKVIGIGQILAAIGLTIPHFLTTTTYQFRIREVCTPH